MNLQSVAVSAASLAFRGECADAWLISDQNLGRCLHAARALNAAWRSASARLPADPRQPVADDERPHTLLAEVLVAEMPVRIAAAIVSAHDRQRPLRHAEPIVRHVLELLLANKRNLLHQALNGAQPLGALFRLDRLRRRCERWTDCLLARLPDHAAVDEQAIDRRRVGEHRLQMRGTSRGPACEALVRAGMGRAFAQELAAPERGELLQDFRAALEALVPEKSRDGGSSRRSHSEFFVLEPPRRSRPAEQSARDDSLSLRFRRLMDFGRDRRTPPGGGEPSAN